MELKISLQKCPWLEKLLLKTLTIVKFALLISLELNFCFDNTQGQYFCLKMSTELEVSLYESPELKVTQHPKKFYKEICFKITWAKLQFRFVLIH